MIRNVYIGSALPPLRFGERPEMSFVDLMELLKANLGASEWEQVRLLRFSIDVENVRRYLRDESIDRRGIFTEKEIDEALLNQVNLPDYILDFLNKYDEDERDAYYGMVLSAFYKQMADEGEGFVKEYMGFERNLRLVLTAYRAIKLGSDFGREFQFEDLNDPMVSFLLANKDAKKLTFPYEFADLERYLMEAGDSPKKQHLTLVKYRYEWIRSTVQKPYFDLDAILGNVMRHILLEDAYSLDSETGLRKMKEAV